MRNQFVQQVVDEALKTYVPGNTHRDIWLENRRNGINHDISGREFVQEGLAGYPHFPEPYFKGYDANTIPGTKFIACQGPSSSTIEKFVEIMLLNEKYPDVQIIGLGAVLGYSVVFHQDFYDYCVVPTVQVTRNFGKYSVVIPELIPTSSTEYNTSLTGHQVFLKTIIKSSLQITTKTTPEKNVTVNATLLPLKDNKSVLFENDSGEQPPLGVFADVFPLPKEQIWELFKSVNQKWTIVHCTSGVGRTGHLILLFEILKNYHHIFGSEDPKTCAAAIHNILHRIRYNRHCLVNVATQFADAITNAHEVYCYAVKKGYELTPYILSGEVAVASHETSELTNQTGYENLSKNPDASINPADRATAIQIFDEQLPLADSLTKILKLSLASEDYINRHRHPNADKVFHLSNTTSWSKSLEKARAQGLAYLTAEIEGKTPEDALKILAEWRQSSLFGKHRNNSIFKGAFGRTNAQKRIDESISEIKKELGRK